MHPLLITVAILTLLGITAQGAVRRAADRNLLHSLAIAESRARRDAHNNFQREFYTLTLSTRAKPPQGAIAPKSNQGAKKRSNQPPQPRPKRQLLAAPTRLSLRSALDNYHRGDETLYNLLGSLIEQLYGSHTFFQSLPNAKEAILSRLREQLQLNEKGQTPYGFIGLPKRPEELAAVPMGDSALQVVWMRMLQGGGADDPIPSLLDYITLTPQDKINVVFAPRELLAAIFPNIQDADSIAQLRDRELEEFHKQLASGDDMANANDLIVAIREAAEVVQISEAIKPLLTYEPRADIQYFTVVGSDDKMSVRHTRRYHSQTSLSKRRLSSP